MTVTSQFLSLLAVDAYNHGYNQGVAALSNIDFSIGNATIFLQSDTAEGSPGVSAGFYGVAYDVGDQIVISYRGTDNVPFNELTTDDARIIFDDYNVDQVHLASQFYNAVQAGNIEGKPIILTGHSLGGALAGL